MDGGKALFKVSTHLVSTVYTQVHTPLLTPHLEVRMQLVLVCVHSFCFVLLFLKDQHLHNFFQHCQSTETSEQASEGELVKYLKVTKMPCS